MPKFLSKEYGPFTGGVWIVIIVGGVGLGLVMRRFMNRDTGEFSPASPAVQGATADPASPAFLGGGTTFNQGEIVAGVLEAIKLQTPPPATTNPVVTAPPSNAGAQARVDALTQKLKGLIATRASVVATHETLKKQYAATPVTNKARRADLLQEIEQYEARRRQLNEQIAGVQAELAFAKTKVVVTT